MNKLSDIHELFSAIQENINVLEKKYEDARYDEEIDNVSKPTVKTTLEHLRSALEYCSQDIYHFVFNTPPTIIYFPYGKTSSDFSRAINKNYPKLKENSFQIYSLIEQLQPFTCDDNWLIDLCKHTNDNKHKKLSKQTRINSEKSITSLGSSITIHDEATVVFSNYILNGVFVGHEEPLIVNNKIPIIELKEQLPKSLLPQREYEAVSFNQENSNIDTLELLKKL